MDHAAELKETALAMVAEGRGILAADESTGTMTKRLDSIGVESTEENRRRFRDLLMTTPDVAKWISGVILFDETIRQEMLDGTPFPKRIEELGIVPGIKVDKGAKDLAGAEGEKVTEGLDGLRERLAEYRELGARFSKWRGVYSITDSLPSEYCISVNAHALARYAALCQEAGIVPIVEPEVLMDGGHTIDRSEEVTRAVLTEVFRELDSQRVMLEGIVLKPNMVLSGYECPEQASTEEVAERTVGLFKEVVPSAVPGIAFLSGGQTDEAASAHLSAMNRIDGKPWALTFSYGRALQAAPLKAWQGEDSNLEAAQKAFTHRATCNSEAQLGRYTEETEEALAA